MKAKAIVAAISLALASCAGVGISVDPDGNFVVSGKLPEKAVVVDGK